MNVEEITVHADHQVKTSKLTIVFGLSAVLALLTAGAMYGAMNERVHSLSQDVTALRSEVGTRESKDAVSLMFGDVRARLGRIEALLDRPQSQRGN
jgi:hypothetical protein